jgi:hypothetical protein
MSHAQGTKELAVIPEELSKVSSTTCTANSLIRRAEKKREELHLRVSYPCLAVVPTIGGFLAGMLQNGTILLNERLQHRSSRQNPKLSSTELKRQPYCLTHLTY